VIKVKVLSILQIKKIIGKGEVEVSIPQGSTVESLLSWMVKTWGERLSSYLAHTEGAGLLPHIRIMVNGQDIGFLKGMETELQEGDEILILPLVAGG
jgi:MoaD family protein